MNHLSEEQLVLYHYGDAGDRAENAAIEEHLHGCEACQVQFAAIRRTLDTVQSAPVPERGDGYGTEIWMRIEPRLAASRRPWWQTASDFFVPRRLVLAGGVAVLIVAAFVAGRLSPGTTQPARPPAVAAGKANGGQPAATQEQVRERILLVAVGDHLERSQMALVELVNTGDGPKVDISAEQIRARDLVSANRLYRATAVSAGENGMASVLDDLERVLLEVANSPSTLTTAEFQKVRERIEAQGIIFKVRVLGDNVREREVRPAPKVASIRG
ncbi:MAG TPA: hypothetical protein VGK32_13780 [Vicinamibacterales bacterium]